MSYDNNNNIIIIIIHDNDNDNDNNNDNDNDSGSDNDDDNDNDNDNGITQMAFPQSGSSSTCGTNGFTSLSKDDAPKEGHPNIQPHRQAA